MWAAEKVPESGTLAAPTGIMSLRLSNKRRRLVRPRLKICSVNTNRPSAPIQQRFPLKRLRTQRLVWNSHAPHHDLPVWGWIKRCFFGALFRSVRLLQSRQQTVKPWHNQKLVTSSFQARLNLFNIISKQLSMIITLHYCFFWCLNLNSWFKEQKNCLSVGLATKQMP